MAGKLAVMANSATGRQPKTMRMCASERTDLPVTCTDIRSWLPRRRSLSPGKLVANTTRYTYGDGEDRYVVSFTRAQDLSKNRMVDTIKGVKRIAAKLAHFDGAYLRFVGELEISRYRHGQLVETFKDDAIWELMYFGHASEVVATSVSEPDSAGSADLELNLQRSTDVVRTSARGFSA